MRRIFMAVAVVGVLSGCVQPVAKLEWSAEPNFDAFSDVFTCRISTWYRENAESASRLSNHLYPVVEMRGNALLVGVMTAPIHSGANLYAGATGDVQIKIDANPTWTIAAIETPPEVQEGTSAAAMNDKIKAMNDAAKEQMIAAIKSNPYADQKSIETVEKGMKGNGADMMASVRAMTSPRTLATGDKAKKILDQMKHGTVLVYRKIGGNGAATSEPSTFPLSGFNEAASLCGL